MNGSKLIAFTAVLVLGMGLFSHGARPKLQAYFTKIECTNQWPELIQISCHLSRTVQNISSLFVWFKFEEDIVQTNGMLTLQVKLKAGNIMLTHSKLEMDYCKALHMVHQQHWLQMIFIQLRRFSNFPLSCPFNKHIDYNVNGLIIDTNLLPSYTPDAAFMLDITFFTRSRQFVELKVFGQVKQK